jgi:hypothetical protein
LTESAIQRAVVVYLEKCFDGLFFHIPNEGKRSQIWGWQQGIRAGVPDLCVLWWDETNKIPRIGFIELKAGKNDLRDSQVRWRESLIALGVYWGLARSVNDVQDLLDNWDAPLKGRIV